MRCIFSLKLKHLEVQILSHQMYMFVYLHAVLNYYNFFNYLFYFILLE